MVQLIEKKQRGQIERIYQGVYMLRRSCYCSLVAVMFSSLGVKKLFGY